MNRVSLILGNLHILPVCEHLDLLAAPVKAAVENMPDADEIGVSEIDPEVSDTAAFCARYEIGPEVAANCVIIEARNGEEQQFVACVVLATTRTDVNGVVRRTVDVKKASFAKMEDAVRESGMEYGAITPIGLPASWPILIDSRVAASERVIIGSGIRKSKLVILGKLLASLPNAKVIEGLAISKEAF